MCWQFYYVPEWLKSLLVLIALSVQCSSLRIERAVFILRAKVNENIWQISCHVYDNVCDFPSHFPQSDQNLCLYVLHVVQWLVSVCVPSCFPLL